MTDEARHYMEPGREFASHEAVNHGEKQYVRYRNEVTDKMRPDGSPSLKPPPSPQTQLKASIRSSSAA